MTPRFRWTCSYMGTMEYEVVDATGAYRVELRREADAYELSIANGDGVRRDVLAAVGILRRCHSVPGGRWFEVSQETVDAFNAWRAAEHAREIAALDAAPERYGIITADNPVRTPPAPAVRGFYDPEQGWVRA